MAKSKQKLQDFEYKWTLRVRDHDPRTKFENKSGMMEF